MERYREGRPLPSELPSSIMFDEALSASIPTVVPHDNAAWRANPAYQQPQTTRAVQPGAFPGKPPRPVPVPLPDDGMQPSRQQKPKVPVLEKHLLDQLSSEEQNSLNSKFQEASDAEKKVAELEKEILDAREKIQFYHSKMQEIVGISSVFLDINHVFLILFCFWFLLTHFQQLIISSFLEKGLFYTSTIKYPFYFSSFYKCDSGKHCNGCLGWFYLCFNVVLGFMFWFEYLLICHFLHLAMVWRSLFFYSLVQWCDGLIAIMKRLIYLLYLGLHWVANSGQTVLLMHFCTVIGIQVFYKSRCDNRLNEITERVSADKREVESLGKKYEEKYRQAGDVASKLTIEEATFRDIQDKKMELYRAIVKLEQDGGGDGIEERVNRIQSELEELVKALNERCKTYGLRAKPTSLVELPFGWQPGVQEGAADWDEKWDLFEDEGFVTVKELTLDVQNVIAPPKPKSTLKDLESSRDGNTIAKPLSGADDKSENVERKPENENDRVDAQGDETASSPSESPVRNNALESEYKEFEDRFKKDASFDGSPHANHSEHGGHESRFDRGFDEPGWDAFDSQYDTDGALDFNHLKKDVDSERQNENSSFGFDDWNLNPIRTGPPRTENIYQKQGPFFDSVPSTPSYNTGNSPVGENIFQRNSTFFADSVPSTPMYSSNNSPRRFEGAERSFDSFSRFDSFNMQDGGLFTPREPMPMAFSRFDSMRSSRDSEYDNGLSATRDSLTRFDSFRSMADSDYNFGLFPPREPTMARFDSTVSNKDSDFGHRFSSFDDADPFGSNDPFKTSLESETPRSQVDWNDHFKVSFDSQTPRRDSDTWNDPFKTSFDSQTPRRDSGTWSAF
ncbi:OLC1v1010500C4 [Oldenlandia corymbosa var. corymbosa]|nr:OLC1v1010500C4 [Oldenlandia corymbosa var. corymbosa]